LKLEALSKISASFELFCLASGMEALGEMMDRDAQAICGPRHARGCDRRAHRWGKTKGNPGGSPARARERLNVETIREMHRAFREHGRKAIDKVIRTKPEVLNACVGTWA
jgi:hypothetical protein